MLSRLFGTDDPGKAPPVLNGATGMDRDNIDKSPVYFLTEDDRQVLSGTYAYAQQQGANLENVDALAATLGMYRQENNGKIMTNFNTGTEFDTSGHQLTSSYSAADTATANRILNGEAIKSTQLDHDFLKYILDPGNALGNATNMDFLEQMVNKFSDVGTASMSLGAKFASGVPVHAAVNDVVLTASKEVVYKAPKTQIANVGGKWIVLDPTILQDKSVSSNVADQKNKAAADLNATLIDGLQSNIGHGVKNNLLTSWLHVLRPYRSKKHS
jgi:hypothetical protein